MSSSQGLSFDFRFEQPGATTAPKSGFTPKPLRVRKQRGQNYDPSLTANMVPPDVETAAGPPNTDIKGQHPTAEERVNEDSLRKINCQVIQEHIKEICTSFDSTDRMSDLDTVALAASWENRLWNVSFGHSDRVSAYTKSIDAADKDLTQWIMNWEAAGGDGSEERTGRQSFVNHVQKYHASELRYTTRTGSLNELMSSEDKHRQTLRNLLSDELETMKALLPASHPLSDFDVAQVVYTWEDENWTTACQQGFNVFEHIEHTEEECENLHFWAEYGDGYPDESIDMTGEARFFDFIRKHLGSADPDASTQHGDGQETRYSVDGSCISDRDSDVGSEDEYEDEEEGYAIKKDYLTNSVAKYLPYYTKNPDDIINRWHEKLLLQARREGGGFHGYKNCLYDDLDTVENCRDSWDLVVQGTGKTGHSLFSELIEECSEEAIARLKKEVEQKEEERRHEHLLNSEEFDGSLNVQDQKRREHRSTLRIAIGDAKTNMDGSHELSDIQAMDLAAHWETQIWTDTPDYRTYLSKMDNFEMDLMEWTQDWPSTLENGQTGEQNFVGYTHRNPDRSVLRCELRRILDSISSTLSSDDRLAGFFTQAVAITQEGNIWIIADESMDKQIRLVRNECEMLHRWYTHWNNVCDQGLTGEENFHQYYDKHFGTNHLPDRDPENHGLDPQTVDELFDLAGGNDTASDDAEDDAGGNGLSDEFLENDDQELVSPRSLKSYHSSDEDDTNETVGRDAQDQSGDQSTTFSVPSGSPSAPSSDNQAAEPMQVDDLAQKQTVDTSHEILISSNQSPVGNNVSTSRATAATDIYSQMLPMMPVDDTAMDGLTYHPVSAEVEMLDGDSSLPAQEETVYKMPTGGLAADSAGSMQDTEMSGSNVSEVTDDNGKPSEPSTTISTGNSSGFLVPYPGPSKFWSTPQVFNRPVSISKNEPKPSGTIFNFGSISSQGQAMTTDSTPFSIAMRQSGVPQIIPQSSTSPPKAVEVQPCEPLITPTDVDSKTAFANVPQEDGAEDREDDPSKKPEVAEAKTILVDPVVVAAPQTTSTFTFKPPKGGIVPIIPSGFDAESWSGGFDFKPLVEDDAVNATFSSGEVSSTVETTEAQEPEVDGPVDDVGADDSHDALSSSPIGTDADATSVPEETKEESPVADNETSDTGKDKIASLTSQSAKIDATNAEADECEQAKGLGFTVEDSEEESEDCSDQIRKISLAVHACDDCWLDANSSNSAPPVFIKIAEDLRTIATNIPNEGDWSSRSALSKIEALSAKWQAFIDTIKTFINITTYFHPDYDYRFKRLSEQYRSDVEMMLEYETLSRLPGAPDHWRKETNKRREARDNKLEVIKDEISKIQDLYQAYYNALETLRANIDCEAMKNFADETLIDFHAKIVRASETFDLQYMKILQNLPNPLKCGGSFETSQEIPVYTKQRKSLPTIIADDEEW